MLRGGGRYRRSSYNLTPPLPGDDDGPSLKAQWLEWIEQESFTRSVEKITHPVAGAWLELRGGGRIRLLTIQFTYAGWFTMYFSTAAKSLC